MTWCFWRIILLCVFSIWTTFAYAELHGTNTPDPGKPWSEYKPWVEAWYFRSARTETSFSNMIQPRLYVPFSMSDQWRGISRIDTSLVSNGGPAFPHESGRDFNPSLSKFTVWAISPEVLPSTTVNFGSRFYLPTGYDKRDYGSTQWAVAPQVGFTVKKIDYGILSEFAPWFRYVIGVSSISTPPTPLARTLEIYPTFVFRIDDHWSVKIWDQRGMVYNAVNGEWFMPIDGVLYYYFDKHWSVAAGGSKQIVNNLPLYQWSGYGRIGYHF
jgi:hypothetical protein